VELVSFTFAAGETKRFERAGRYLEIIDSAAAIDIQLTDNEGGAVDYATGALSGLYMESSFAAITMKSATAQTVTLLVTDGRGGSRRQPGNVVIVDKVSSAVQTQAAGATAISAFTATPIFLPAANTSGAIVRGIALEVQAGAGGNSDCSLLAGPAAPTATIGNPLLCLGRLVDAAGVRQVYNAWDLRRQIPPGWGLWHCAVNTTAIAAANAGRASFELL